MSTTASYETVKSVDVRPTYETKDGEDKQPFRADVLNELIPTYHYNKGVGQDHVQSLNDFYNIALVQIISSNRAANSTITKLQANINDGVESISWEFTYTDIVLNKPFITKAKGTINTVPLMPNEAVARGITYAGALYVRIVGKVTIAYTDREPKVIEASVRRHIGDIPIGVGTTPCNTAGKSAEALIALGESPSGYGGYFILKGVEYRINPTENTTHNMAKNLYNLGHRNEHVRFEMICKPGDGYENSARIFIKLLTNGQIVVIVNRDPLSDIIIPFYTFFRLFGWDRDDRIIDNIMIDEDPVVNQHIQYRLSVAYGVKFKQYPGIVDKYDREDIIRTLTEGAASFGRWYSENTVDSLRMVREYFMKSLDRYAFMHIGAGPEFREEKLRAMCFHLHEFFLVEMKVIPGTDRDSLPQKRIHPAGAAMSKTLKTRWNKNINQPISSAIDNDVRKTPASKLTTQHINKLLDTLPLVGLLKGLTQPIVESDKAELKVGNSVIVNRISSDTVKHTSPIGLYAACMQVHNPGDKTQKQSERAKVMRGVHSTNDGYFCPIQSQEGQSVGLNKQMSALCRFTLASSSTVLKNIVRRDVTHWKDTTPAMKRAGYKAVLVNGHIVGYHNFPPYIVDKYRHMRRVGKVDANTTIYMDPIKHTVDFYVDLGRCMQLLVVVYNNKPNTYVKPADEESKKPFHQWTKITKQHVYRMKMNDPNVLDELLTIGAVEWISSGEQLDMLVAPSLDEFWENRDNKYKAYTHVRVSAALLGMTMLMTPNVTCNQTVRPLYASNHVRHSNGIADDNWPYLYLAEQHYGPHNEIPLTRTVAHKMVRPNGNNYACLIVCRGKNQEDSVIINQDSIDMGRCPGIFATDITGEFDFSDKIGMPDPTNTDMNPHINYATAGDNGVPAIGTVLNKDDAVICVYVEKSNPGAGEHRYVDRTITYTKHEPAIVVDVFPRDLRQIISNEDGKRIVRVKYMLIKPNVVGDKSSTPEGQKGITSETLPGSEIPYTREGIQPNIIVNSHSQPSRMTVGMLINMAINKVCAQLGVSIDATAFKDVNTDSIADALEMLGMSRGGTTEFYNPYNGELMQGELMFGPEYYVRVQKFWSDNFRVVNGGAIDLMSRHITNHGPQRGLKQGYMENDAYHAVGMPHAYGGKIYDESNGYPLYMCSRCNESAMVHRGSSRSKPFIKCVLCGSSTNVYEVQSSWSSKNVTQIQNTCGIGMKFHKAPMVFPVYADSVDDGAGNDATDAVDIDDDEPDDDDDVDIDDELADLDETSEPDNPTPDADSEDYDDDDADADADVDDDADADDDDADADADADADDM